jgi:23S rRNA pseudouridine1911/1915/1917 synthase
MAYEAAFGFPRQALHAGLLGFHHPKTAEPLRFESPWPSDFSKLIKVLREILIK